VAILRGAISLSMAVRGRLRQIFPAVILL